MGYFKVRYDSRVINYNRRGFIRLATGLVVKGEDLTTEVLSSFPGAGYWMGL